MGTFAFIILSLLSCFPLAVVFVLIQMWWAFGYTIKEIVLVIFLISLSIGGFYLASQYLPFEITVRGKV